MADTLWADVSEWQVPVNDSYPYQVLAIRADDGTYRDIDFAVDYAWAHAALDSGKLKALVVYCVYRQNWADTLATFKSMVGVPHPRMVVMIDVESWGGQITGNQSAGINALYDGLASWLDDPRRVIGYGNVGDLNALWPQKPAGIRLIVAAYGSNPAYPGKIGHQFASNYPTPPFGPCDINSADGMDVDTFCVTLGLGDDMAGLTPDEHTMLAALHDAVLNLQTSRVANSTYQAAPVPDYLMNVDSVTWRTGQALDLQPGGDTQYYSATLNALAADIEALGAKIDAFKADVATVVSQAIATGVVAVDVTVANKTKS